MKFIRTPELSIEEYLKQCEEQLKAHLSSTSNTTSGININLKTELPEIAKEDMPKIYILDSAYIKIRALVSQCSKEIAWHGVVEYHETKNTYLIKDILMYPQIATGTTVTSDDDPYNEWFSKLEDTTFFNVRYQGHSHVNIGTGPSSVDTGFYDQVIASYDEKTPNPYYIFHVTNKNDVHNLILFDFKRNIIFENKDLDLVITSKNGLPIKKWAEANIEKYMKENTPVTAYGNNLLGQKFYGHSDWDNLTYGAGDTDSADAYWARVRNQRQNATKYTNQQIQQANKLKTNKNNKNSINNKTIKVCDNCGIVVEVYPNQKYCPECKQKNTLCYFNPKDWELTK